MRTDRLGGVENWLLETNGCLVLLWEPGSRKDIFKVGAQFAQRNGDHYRPLLILPAVH